MNNDLSNIESLIKSNANLEFTDSLFFPLSERWKWYPIIQSARKISPGARYVVWDRSSSGWIYFVSVEADNPDLTIVIELLSQNRVELAISFRSLYNQGLVGLSQGLITVTRYSDEDKEYFMVYSPIGFGVPFRDRCRCSVLNPTRDTITLKSFITWLIELD